MTIRNISRQWVKLFPLWTINKLGYHLVSSKVNILNTQNSLSSQEINIAMMPQLSRVVISSLSLLLCGGFLVFYDLDTYKNTGQG